MLLQSHTSQTWWSGDLHLKMLPAAMRWYLAPFCVTWLVLKFYIPRHLKEDLQLALKYCSRLGQMKDTNGGRAKHWIQCMSH